MLFENSVPLNMRLRMQPKSATAGRMADIFAKRIWQPCKCTRISFHCANRLVVLRSCAP